MLRGCALSRAVVLAAALLWALPAAADQTIGAACSGSAGDAAQSGNGNNVYCNGSTIQYPAYQFGNTSASCNATNAGMTRYSSGSLQYCDSSTWQTISSSGNGALILISTQTASASASLQWTGLTGNNYMLTCTALEPTTNNDTLYTRFGEGATPTWDSDANYQYDGNANLGSNYNVSAIPLTGTSSNASGAAPSGHWFFYGLATSGIDHEIEGSAFNWNGTQHYFAGGGLYFGTTNVITAIEVYYGAGTIASGTCSLYRMNN